MILTEKISNTESYRETGMHCSKKRHHWHQIMPVVFTGH